MSDDAFRVRGYMGDTRGHWEDNTLVIDTANFIGTDNFYGADENMQLTERLTRTGPNTILYQFTVNVVNNVGFSLLRSRSQRHITARKCSRRSRMIQNGG